MVRVGLLGNSAGGADVESTWAAGSLCQFILVYPCLSLVSNCHVEFCFTPERGNSNRLSVQLFTVVTLQVAELGRTW